MDTGPESGQGVITLATSLNAVPLIVWGRRTQVSTTPRAPNSRPPSGPWLTERESSCSSSRMNAEQRLVTRGHIDFGRVWSAACCA
ncbi:hypothetical protein SCNRRL3882_0557 [Streptomyces chartreusis NRRL 3882]|uniref:Uncharacterized protein n=1 Tax=Streptomyces chartreusis NRRL 3882 TaxID=1079985 RepID=A0A2N9B191_STRCX|nr:hypothetical protein SCNRRL3882_0557 [Streptomyces chartreusis NRRL 3882]